MRALPAVAALFVVLNVLDVWLTVVGLEATGGRGEVNQAASAAFDVWGFAGLAVLKLVGGSIFITLVAAFWSDARYRALGVVANAILACVVAANAWAVWPVLFG